jgi:hypothetical protein
VSQEPSAKARQARSHDWFLDRVNGKLTLSLQDRRRNDGGSFQLTMTPPPCFRDIKASISVIGGLCNNWGQLEWIWKLQILRNERKW